MTVTTGRAQSSPKIEMKYPLFSLLSLYMFMFIIVAFKVHQGFRLNLGKSSKMTFFVQLMATFNVSINLFHYMKLAGA